MGFNLHSFRLLLQKEDPKVTCISEFSFEETKMSDDERIGPKTMGIHEEGRE